MRQQRDRPLYKTQHIEEYVLDHEPFYLPVQDEVQLFEAAYADKVPVLLKGPTGSGKTRFIEFMSYRLGQRRADVDGRGGLPLVTVACHEDPHGQRPRGAVPPRARGHALDGRPPDPRREDRGDLLPR